MKEIADNPRAVWARAIEKVHAAAKIRKLKDRKVDSPVVTVELFILKQVSYTSRIVKKLHSIVLMEYWLSVKMII